MSQSQNWRDARLAAFCTLLDSDNTNPGELLIYSGTRPSPGGTPSGFILARVIMKKPSLDNVTSNILTIKTPDDILISTSGYASWARFTSGSGLWICDVDVSLPGGGAEIEIDNGSLASLVLYAGGTLSVTLPRIQES